MFLISKEQPNMWPDGHDEHASPRIEEEGCTVSRKRNSCVNIDAASTDRLKTQERRLIRATITGFMLIVLALAHHHSTAEGTVLTGSDSLRGASAEWSSSIETSPYDEPQKQNDIPPLDTEMNTEWSDLSKNSFDSLEKEPKQQESNEESLDALWEDSSADTGAIMYNMTTEELADKNVEENAALSFESEPSDDAESDHNFVNIEESEDSQPEHDSTDEQTINEANVGEEEENLQSSQEALHEFESEESDETSQRYHKQQSFVEEKGVIEDEEQGRMEDQGNGN
jgi:hypothetical protein